MLSFYFLPSVYYKSCFHKEFYIKDPEGPLILENSTFPVRGLFVHFNSKQTFKIDVNFDFRIFSFLHNG